MASSGMTKLLQTGRESIPAAGNQLPLATGSLWDKALGGSSRHCERRRSIFRLCRKEPDLDSSQPPDMPRTEPLVSSRDQCNATLLCGECLAIALE